MRILDSSRGYTSSRNVRGARRAFNFLWFAISVMSFLLHLHTWFQAYYEVKSEIYYRLYQTYRDYIDEGYGGSALGFAKHTTTILITAPLHWNAWLGAVIEDVFLSAICLCLWSLVSRPDPRTMVKCSIFPWVDEVQAAAGRTARRMSVATDQIYEELQLSQPLARARDIYSTAKEEARRRTTSAFHAFEDTEDDNEHTYGRATMNTRSRSARRASVGSPGRSQSRSRVPVSPAKRGPDTSISRRRSRVRRLSLSERLSGLLDEENEEILRSTCEEVIARTEAAGLALALATCGGFGVASAAVFGAAEGVN